MYHVSYIMCHFFYRVGGDKVMKLLVEGLLFTGPTLYRLVKFCYEYVLFTVLLLTAEQ